MTTANTALVVATSNSGKLAEIQSLLSGHSIRVLRPMDVLGHGIDVVEDGESFEANATLKAHAVGKATRLLTLADDSGLEVDALGGLPGVRSARFAGERATDDANNRELLRRLECHTAEPVLARFRCAMALFDPLGDRTEVVSAKCEGRITRLARGTLGFGYDPLFVVTELGDRTMAELEPAEKNAVSHRGRALRAILPRVLAWAEG